MPFALDFSTHPGPSPVQVLSAGYVGIISYVGFDPAVRPKCLTAAEYAAYVNAGVGVGLVYEDQAGDMLAGRDAGRTAAQRARTWATRICFPTDRPIYYACDTDIVSAAQFDQVLSYMRGVLDVEVDVSRVGIYGEYDVCERVLNSGAARWCWQTRAWSAGRLYSRAHLRQEIGQVTVGSVVCDRNTVLAQDWGQAGTREIQEDDPMALFDSVEDFQAAVAAAVSGTYRGSGSVEQLLRRAHVGTVTDGWHSEDWGSISLRGQLVPITRSLAALTAQVTALSTLLAQMTTDPGGLSGEDARRIALDAAQEALDGVTITIHGDEDPPADHPTP